MSAGTLRERAVHFGRDGALVGVYTPADAPSAGRPVVLLVNSGVICRVGPNRLYVEAARHFAREGFDVLRFDLSGIGDSAARRASGSIGDVIDEDLREAVAEACRLSGATSVVCMGICLGADTSFSHAARDPRVEGLVLLDPYVFRTRGFYLRWLASRVLNPASWRRLLDGSTLRVVRRKRAGAGAAGPLPEHYLFERQAQPDMERAYASLVARGVRFFVAFTGGTRSWYNYPTQFIDAFPRVDFDAALELRHWPEADHTFTRLDARGAMLADVGAWLAQRYPLSADGAGQRASGPRLRRPA